MHFYLAFICVFCCFWLYMNIRENSSDSSPSVSPRKLTALNLKRDLILSGGTILHALSKQKMFFMRAFTVEIFIPVNRIIAMTFLADNIVTASTA